MPNLLDLTGKVFGEWTVIRRDNAKELTYWLCSCSCGTIRSVYQGSLKRGRSVSCGCLNRSADGRKGEHLKNIWTFMLGRCNDPKRHDYERYGGRGVTVCEEWSVFEVFYAWAIESGYKIGLTLDRKDNDGKYEPQNCKWATPIEQANNRRSSHLLTIDGQTRTIMQWSRESGIEWHTIAGRLKRQWNAREAVFSPLKPGGRIQMRRGAAK